MRVGRERRQATCRAPLVYLSSRSHHMAVTHSSRTVRPPSDPHIYPTCTSHVWPAPGAFADETQNEDGSKSPGFVLASRSAVQSRVLCSFPTDSGTNFIKCTPLGGGPGSVYATPEGTPVDADHCVPGCSPARCGIDPPWTTCGYDTCQECAYHGGEGLRQMMVAHDQMQPRDAAGVGVQRGSHRRVERGAAPSRDG